MGDKTARPPKGNAGNRWAKTKLKQVNSKAQKGAKLTAAEKMCKGTHGLSNNEVNPKKGPG